MLTKNLDTTSEAEPNSVTDDILGSDPAASPHPGPIIIHEEITNRWSTFAKKGIDKADRKNLLQKYPSLKPPVLKLKGLYQKLC